MSVANPGKENKMEMVKKCIDCGHKGDYAPRYDGRTALRCSKCDVHFQKRKKYTNPMQQTRSRTLELLARKDKRRSKHCPRCHHLRRKDAYVVFNDPYGVCVLCRDEDFSAAQLEQHLKRDFTKEGLIYDRKYFR